LLEMTGKYKKGQGIKTAQKILESGKALKKMQDIITAQGKQKKPKLGKLKHQAHSKKSGKVKEIDNEIIAKIARIAGAPKDKGAGIYVAKRINEKVKNGELLYTVYAENRFKLNLALKFLRKNNGYSIS